MVISDLVDSRRPSNVQWNKAWETWDGFNEQLWAEVMQTWQVQVLQILERIKYIDWNFESLDNWDFLASTFSHFRRNMNNPYKNLPQPLVYVTLTMSTYYIIPETIRQH